MNHGRKSVPSFSDTLRAYEVEVVYSQIRRINLTKHKTGSQVFCHCYLWKVSKTLLENSGKHIHWTDFPFFSSTLDYSVLQCLVIKEMYLDSDMNFSGYRGPAANSLAYSVLWDMTECIASDQNLIYRQFMLA